MNHLNICPSCVHRNDCVLTAQKDKVWSCSEYDALTPEAINLAKVPQSKRVLELV
ncbi:hypothetical protein [Winogradskyella bathintestinalis]|uniref:Uncharacterized protein n=1 Tax=Winogradskyella bathintestinalis TaxID=3035208 RepID=A0ABT7ZVI7_9FLAO|nr:hypothetical protein [Winogradskyella bathintestinalis]MDN3492834.1 hypothetical protein [Winogradskyella bathintestinalis]